MKKILFLTVDGTHQNVIKLLLKDGFEVDLLAKSKHQGKVEKRFKALSSEGLNLIYGRNYLNYFFKSIAYSRKVDLILSNCPMSGFFSIILALFKKKYFLMCQDHVEYLKVSKMKLKYLYILLYKILLNIVCRFSHVIAISNYVAGRARKYGARKMSIVPIYGVDTSLFYPKKSYLRKKFGLTNKKVLLCSSRLSEEKGLEYLLFALKELKEIFPDIFLIIVGTGPLENKLKKKVFKLCIEDYVKFIGFIDFEDMPDYYNACDVFIAPSLREGLGLSVLEAMACGKPVIASHVGGLMESVLDNETGLSIKTKNPKALYDAILKIFSDKLNTTRLINNAKKMILKDYKQEVVAKKLGEILK